MAVKLTQEDREDLIHALRVNRQRSIYGGSGPSYWNSVVDVVEEFLTYVKDRREKEKVN